MVLACLACAKEPEPLILYRIGDVPVEMLKGDEFGVMLINDGGGEEEEEPSPRYILALAGSRTVLDTKDLGLFRELLKRIPEGSVIFRYDSCSVPRAWGLNEKQISDFQDSFKKQGLSLSEDPRITCYCETPAK